MPGSLLPLRCPDAAARIQIIIRRNTIPKKNENQITFGWWWCLIRNGSGERTIATATSTFLETPDMIFHIHHELILIPFFSPSPHFRSLFFLFLFYTIHRTQSGLSLTFAPLHFPPSPISIIYIQIPKRSYRTWFVHHSDATQPNTKLTNFKTIYKNT